MYYHSINCFLAKIFIREPVAYTYMYTRKLLLEFNPI